MSNDPAHALAAAIARPGPETAESVLAEAGRPLKYRHSPCSVWQAYVPDEVACLWEELPVEARLVAYCMARTRLSTEP